LPYNSSLPILDWLLYASRFHCGKWLTSVENYLKYIRFFMVLQDPQQISIRSIPLAGYLRSGNIAIPPTSNTDYLFSAMYLPSESPMGMRAYYPDTRSQQVVQNFNSAYPGLEWMQQFEVIGGNGPILYELVQAPAGMTMVGQVARDPVTGYFVPGEFYSFAVWQNPIAGRYRIGVRATDQLGEMVYWIFDLFVSTERHFFMAMVATGNGSGSSPSNYASYTNTILGATTVSPSKNKVLHVKGDVFPATTGINASTQFVAASWVNMPAETPTFSQKFNLTSDNFSLYGLKFLGVSTSSFGIVGSSGAANNIGLIDCVFDGCINGDLGVSDNQSCIGFTRAGPTAGREIILVSGCEFKNSTDLHGFDYYRIKDHKFSRNKLTITNGTSALTRSWIFPKQEVFNSEIEYNTANIPGVSGGTVSVAQLYNSVVGGSPESAAMLINFRNNYINVGGGLALQLQQDEGTVSNLVNFDNYITRNTIVGGRVQVAHWVSDGKPNRRNFLESNIIVNSDNGATVRDPGFAPVAPNTTDWFFESGTNVKGITGIVDASGHLPPADPNRGKTGHGIWRPE
jgi:hypothetical protein